MLIAAVLIALVSTGTFLCLVYGGCFARFQKGFLVSLVVAVGGAAFVSSGLFGVWAWKVTEKIMLHQVTNDLHDDLEVVTPGLFQGTRLAMSNLQGEARVLGDRFAEGNLDAFVNELEIFQQSHRQFLADRVIGLDGKTKGAHGRDGILEPINHTAVQYALSGKTYISQAYFSPVFKRYIVYTAVPIRDRKGVTVGALTCQYDLQTDLENIVSAARFGKSGYIVVASDQGRMIASVDPSRVNEDISAYEAVRHARQGERGWLKGTNNAGVKRLFYYVPADFPATSNVQRLVLLVELDTEEAMQPIYAARRFFLLGMALVTILALVSGYIISVSMVKPVNSMNGFVKKVEAGDLSARLPIQCKKDEIWRLGLALNEMAASVEEREKLRESIIASHQVLELAHQIQMGLLPQKFPAFPDTQQIDIHGTLRPALEVGGDMYSFFRLDENRICFLVGDVSDKGVPAALFMAMVLTSFEISAKSLVDDPAKSCPADSIGAVLGRVNNFLNANNDSQMFVTLFAGILDLRTGIIEYSDGGHEPPFILRRDGRVEMLQKEGGVALGFFPEFEFPVGTIHLNSGDTLVLYTDGINEAMNSEHKMFTTTAIGETLRSLSGNNSSEKICEVMIRSVDEFVCGAPQSDDITLLVVRYCGPQMNNEVAEDVTPYAQA